MGSAKCILLQSQRIQLPSEAAGSLWLSPCPAPCGLSPFLSQPWALCSPRCHLRAHTRQERALDKGTQEVNTPRGV